MDLFTAVYLVFLTTAVLLVCTVICTVIQDLLRDWWKSLW
jgi:hypothetical protein